MKRSIMTTFLGLVIAGFVLNAETLAASSKNSSGKQPDLPSSATSEKPEEKEVSEQAKNDKGKGEKGEEKLFADIIIQGKVLRVRDEVAVDTEDKVVAKGLGIRLNLPVIQVVGSDRLAKKFEHFHQQFGVWLGTQMKNEIALDDCANAAHKARKDPSASLKVTFKNFPVHSLYWKDQVHLINHLKQWFRAQIKSAKMKDKDISELAKKKHLLGHISAGVDNRAVSCEIASP